MILSEASRTALFAALGIAFVFTWVALQARRAAGSPTELVAQLRFAQLAALLLVLVAGAYLGFATVQETRSGVGVDIALALGFFVVASTATVRDPREALTILALAFAAHALVDILHRPGGLPEELVPQWYLVGCAAHNVYMAALCYLPLLRR